MIKSGNKNAAKGKKFSKIFRLDKNHKPRKIRPSSTFGLDPKNDSTANRNPSLGKQKACNKLQAFITSGGLDGTRTRDPMRDRHVF